MTPRRRAALTCFALATLVNSVAAAQTEHHAAEFYALPHNAAALLAAPSDGASAAASSARHAFRSHTARAYAPTDPARGSQQASGDQDRARRAFEHGVQLADQLQWAEAADSFAESYRLFARPATLRNLGLAHRAMGHYTQAIDELQRFQNEGNPEPDVRAQVAQVINDMNGQLNTIVVVPSVSGATLTLDDHPIHANEEIHADPGPHVIAATASGYARAAQNITLGHAEHRRFDLRLEHGSGGILSQWWLWTIVGAVVVGGVVVTVVLLSHEEPPNCGTLNVCVSPR